MIGNKYAKDRGIDLRCAVGPLLYCPADNDVSKNLLSGKLGNLNTLVMCLEDAILPENVAAAEVTLRNTFDKLAAEADISELPMIFVRVRDPEHLKHIYPLLSKYRFLTGYVLPKFDTSNMEQYGLAMRSILVANSDLVFMPILESGRIMGYYRRKELRAIHDFLCDSSRYKHILNILVGSNDMCVKYNVRRNVKQTVYDIGAVRNVLIDIVEAFHSDFIINGPVWEYFDGPYWDVGLKYEIELDKLNGFVGKACIHPKQVAVVQEALKVDSFDLEDAKDLVNWDSTRGVQKSKHSGRMNELATNLNWAIRILTLGTIYGVK